VKREAPFDVAAGATEVVDCALEPATPGPFEAQLHVYVADPGLREMVLLVRGTARSAAPAGSPPSNPAPADPPP